MMSLDPKLYCTFILFRFCLYRKKYENRVWGIVIRSFSQKDVPAIARPIAAKLRNHFPSPYKIEDAKSWINLVQKQKPERQIILNDKGYSQFY